MGELSRTLALAVRLFGNMMSGTKIVAILLANVPFFFPIVMYALGLLTGLIQAYIFAILAMVYIASATRAQEPQKRIKKDKGADNGKHKPESRKDDRPEQKADSKKHQTEDDDDKQQEHVPKKSTREGDK